MRDAFHNLRARLGPGLLFAAAAVGTSHVVQATRGGASFGLTLAGLIIIVCLLKYPLFRFAADYASATGESLVRGYGRRGTWLVWLTFVAAAIEAIAATAGVSLVTAAIAQWIIGTTLPDAGAAVALLVVTAAIVGLGRYRLLEHLTLVLVVALSLLTVIATVASVSALTEGSTPAFGAFDLTAENTSFAIAMSGWMPIGNIAAIMLAAWILAKQAQTPDAHAASPIQRATVARFDFNVGYISSAVLAVCFLAMGAAVLYGQGESMPGGSAAFVASFVGLYAASIGSWATLIVSIAALAVMYSTLLAIVDGFPRLLGEFGAELHAGRRRRVGGRAAGADPVGLRLYPIVLVVLGSSLLLLVFFDGFAGFVDLVTITGFVIAPIVALANQMVIQGSNVPADCRPSPALVRWNVVAVALLALATLGFLYMRFLGG